MRSFAKSALVALSAVQTVYGHFGIGNFYVNGADQGEGICVRMNKNPSTWNFPIEDLTSTDMACGFTGTEGVNRVCPVPDGATISFKWREAANNPGGVVDPSHMGPCSVYMKKVEDAITDKAAGDGWFKVWDHGYDEKSKKWCTTKLIENGGWMSFDIPKGLVGGDYLIRGEALALHAADQGDPQYYMSCAQVFLQSTGSKVPESTVAIPGAMKINDKSNSFNIWENPMKLPYPVPGPAVVTFKDGGSPSTATSPAKGLRPDNCILEAGSNWCAVEVPDYTDSNSCWKSVDTCWKQADDCWAKYPPTGYESCKTWQAKCEAQGEDCKANKSGPPNKGKVLDPVKKTVAVPAAVGPTTLNGVVSTQPTDAPAPVSSNKATYTTGGSWGTPSSVPAVPGTVVKAPVPEASQPAGDYSSPPPAKNPTPTPSIIVSTKDSAATQAPPKSSTAAPAKESAPAPGPSMVESSPIPSSAPVSPPAGGDECSTVTSTRTLTATVTVDASGTTIPKPQEKVVASGVSSAVDAVPTAANAEPEEESCDSDPEPQRQRHGHRKGRKHSKF